MSEMSPTVHRAITYLQGDKNQNVVWQLAHDKVPIQEGEHLVDLNIAYDVYGDGTKFHLTVMGRALVLAVLNRTKFKGYNPSRNVVTPAEKRQRAVDKVRHNNGLEQVRIYKLRRFHDREPVLNKKGVAKTDEQGSVIYRSITRAHMETRTIEHTECVSCGCEIDYKILRIFDRRKKYECVVCGKKVRPKSLPGRNVKGSQWAGRLPTILIGDSGFAAVVCWDCIDYCQYCWTDGTYKYIARQYGVDLRDA